jgi:Tfp pilus assembly protein PilE
MIAIIAGGVAFIVIVAIVVGIVDSVRAPAWRRIAAERRENWETRQFESQQFENRQFETHGPARAEKWDDD